MTSRALTTAVSVEIPEAPRVWREVGADVAADAVYIDPLPTPVVAWEEALARLLGWPWAGLRPWHVAQICRVPERAVEECEARPRVLPVYDGDAPEGYALSAASAT